MVDTYVPQSGDILDISFNPQTGHEQSGRRPALVVSSALYHQKTNMLIVCPITNTVKGFPLHLKLPQGLRTTGVIMCEQVRSLDYKQRQASFVERAPVDILRQAREIVALCMED